MAALAVATYGAVAALRLTYPFELEWMEGATLEHVRRVLNGAPLYARPSLDFIAFTYPPLYYYLAAAVSHVVGPGFVALRAVSIAASFGSLCVIYAMVRIESGRAVAVVSAGLFAATYALSDAWFDLGRVDSLYLCLALATGLVLSRASRPWQFAAAGLLAALALLAKQTIVVSLGFVSLYLLITAPLGCLCFAAAAVAAGGGTEWWLNVRSGGWFRYYAYDLPRMRVAISARTSRLALFLWSDMTRPLAPLMAGTIAAWWWRLADEEAAATRDRRRRVVLFAAGLILSALLARLEGGSWTNALLPAYAALPLLFGIAAGGRHRHASVVPCAVILQFALLAYDPRRFVPGARDNAAGRAVLAEIAALPDGTLVLDHGYLSAMAGKRTFAHGWAMTDVLWADHRGAGRALEAEVHQAIVDHRFPALVLDDTPHWFARDFATYYRVSRPLPDRDAFQPRSGSRRRPATILLPR